MSKNESKHSKSLGKNQGKLKGESNNSKVAIYLLLAALIITYICFSNAIKNDFTNWDDPGYVTDNTLVKKSFV